MTMYELLAASVALGAVVVPVVTWVVLRLIRRDRIFSSVPPGVIPADPVESPSRFVSKGAQYWGDVAARATPPAGISPGLAGVVLDGSADGRDIAAMILDLARRGWLELRQVSGADGARGDWAITRAGRALDATLDLNEVHLVTNIAEPGGTAWLSELCSAQDNRLALVQQDLYREVVARGWYSSAPLPTSDIPMAVLGLGGLLGLVIAVVHVTGVTLGAGAVIVACAYLTSLIVRGGTPRTALGTAVRIQVLGVRRYLDEAKSYQFSYEDALETFRTYLPWAVVFEREDQWADVFATLDVVASTSELHFAQDLGWFATISDRDRSAPPPAPVGEATAPRRGAYGEEDVVSTVLMSSEELAAERRSGATVTIAGRSLGTSGAETAGSASVPVGSPAAVASGSGAGIGSALRRTASSAVGVLAQKLPSVRQWVRTDRVRPATLRPPEQPAVAPSAAPSSPAALVTPRRAPAAEAPVTSPPAPAAPVPPELPREPAAGVLDTRLASPCVPEPRTGVQMLSDWISEFDDAMAGDVMDREVDATDGGTVISGPGRFDVLLKPPLWPDVPHGEDDTRRIG